MAHSMQLPIVYEYAREYLEENGPEYKEGDLKSILNGQYDAEDEAHARSNIIICDTDWLTIHIWSMVKYGNTIRPPRDLDERHYILCPPDIPWEPDPLRENPADRAELYQIYLQALEEYELSYEVLER